MKTICLKSICLIVILVLTSSFSFGQAGRGIGRLKGNVTNEKSQALKGVEITLKFLDEEGSIRKVITDSKGEWSFIGLGYGKYDITAEVKGYDTFTKRMLVSQMNRNPFTNLKLKVSKKEKLKKELASVNKGLELYKQKKFDEALMFFNKFAAKYPEKTEINVFIGNCLKELQRYDEAAKKYLLVTFEKDSMYNKVIAAKGFAAIGEIYVLKNDLKGAKFYFESSISLNPKDEILAYNVGEIYFGNNNPDGAIKYYKIASEIKPGWAIPHVKLGYAYLNKGDIKSAVESFKKFLEIDNNSPESATIKEIIKSL